MRKVGINFTEELNMSDFITFLKEKQRVTEKKVPFYLHWISKYYKSLLSIMKNTGVKNHLKEVREIYDEDRKNSTPHTIWVTDRDEVIAEIHIPTRPIH